MKLIKGASKVIFFPVIVILFTLLYSNLIFGQTPQSENTIQDSIKQNDSVNTKGANQNFFEQKHLTGNWWGGRSYLENRGVKFDFRYTST